MCGVAGIYVSPRGSPPQEVELDRMAAAIAHRGPDGHGTYLDDRAGLAHARLSILDLEGGWQPLSNEDDTIWIAFNGEVFNYIELRDQLESRGHRFRTRSDTEVIVHAYEEWGVEAWARLNGQFAVALRDLKEECLWLVRDRVGIAPLQYSLDGDQLVFGSEAKAIFASRRVAARPDPEGLLEVFSLWAPCGASTAFDGVSNVPPGVALRFGRELDVRAHRFHCLRFDAGPSDQSRSIEDSASELASRLEGAVRLRLRADVPVGAYLSGGLDSAVITKLVRMVDTSPLQTFSVRFDDRRYDEGQAQARMTRELGTVHHEIVATPERLAGELPSVVRHCETPLLRTAPIPMFLLSSLVRSLGMRVVLTGEGADEFIGGYDLFKEDKIRRSWARQPDSTCRPQLLSRVHPYVASGKGAMWQEFFRRGLAGTLDPFYSHRLRWDNTAWARRFLAPDIRTALDEEALDARIEAAMPPEWRDCGPLERAQHIEIVTFMTAYLLSSQGDRVLLGHGVEGRFPFLDPEVMAWCARLGSTHKLCGLREKVALRRVARGMLPAEVAERRKWPYRAPIGQVLFGPDAPEYVRSLLSPESLAGNGLVDARSAASLAARALGDPARLGEREEMALLGILSLQLWSTEFLGKASTADPTASPSRVRIDLRSRRSQPEPPLR